MKKIIHLLLVLLFVSQARAERPQPFATADYVAALKQVTDVMVYDVTSPVAASRYYAYITLAANEVYAASDPAANSLKGQLRGFAGISIDAPVAQQANASFAAVYALYKMGEKLLSSGKQLQPFSDSLVKSAAAKGVSKETIEQSVMLVQEAIKQLASYIQADGFKNLSGYARYKPLTGDAYWQPTAPVFMQPVEPWWARLRPFLLDSCQQFKPALPIAFDTSHAAPFYSLMQEVYTTKNNLTQQQAAIAAFWDCNPFAV